MNKRIIWKIAAVIVCGTGVYWGMRPDFDSEKILAQSVLKERNFAGEAKEIKAFDGKLSAYFMEEHSVPLVAISFGFEKAGKAYEPMEGVGLLTESSLLDGAGAFSRKELREEMKEKGIHISVGAGADNLNFSLSYVKKFEKEAWDILRDIIYKPRLNADDLALTKQQLAVARVRQYENPSYHLGKLVDEHFYQNHPYGRDSIPADDVLQKITADDIRAYLREVMHKDNFYGGIAGDLTEDEAKAFLEYVFDDLSDSGKVRELPEWQPDFNQPKEVEELGFSAQSFVLMAGEGVKRLDDDFYPLYLANDVFGGSGLNSRLNKAIREKEGLTYGIYSYLSNSDAVDLWQIYFSAAPKNVEKVLSIAKAEYDAFYNKGITEEELAQAKNGMMASFNLRFSSLGQIAGMLASMQQQKLGIDFLRKRQGLVSQVSLEQVNDAIVRRMPKGLGYYDKVRRFEIMGK